MDPPKKKSTCDLVADQPGKVFIDFGSASFVAGIGLSGSIGVFKNLSTGSGGFSTLLGEILEFRGHKESGDTRSSGDTQEFRGHNT